MAVALASGGFGFRSSAWIWLDAGRAGTKLLLCRKSGLLKKRSCVFSEIEACLVPP